MAKKTARSTRPSQQRTKEEQWRKRMAAQAQTGTSATLVEPNGYAPGADTAQMDVAPVGSPSAARATSAASTARTATSSAAMQRRAVTAARASRARMGANTLTIDEEMRYVKLDIRKLVILTAICLAILIILSFIVPSVIK